jgi:hypothetical protein
MRPSPIYRAVYSHPCRKGVMGAHWGSKERYGWVALREGYRDLRRVPPPSRGMPRHGEAI